MSFTAHFALEYYWYLCHVRYAYYFSLCRAASTPCPSYPSLIPYLIARQLL
jgi:hypothetical protein